MCVWLWVKAGDKLELDRVPIPFLLPHEQFHAITEAGPQQIQASLSGDLDGPALESFWAHCILMQFINILYFCNVFLLFVCACFPMRKTARS
jgi:hypothetical protein